MVDWANMEFPNYLRIDFVRVYQRSDGSGTLGCDPPDMPTKDYIERHIEVYSDPNITTWAPGKFLPPSEWTQLTSLANAWPKNRLIDTC
jgi:hypothetical protein